MDNVFLRQIWTLVALQAMVARGSGADYEFAATNMSLKQFEMGKATVKIILLSLSW
jgi:hypothetical protein